MTLCEEKNVHVIFNELGNMKNPIESDNKDMEELIPIQKVSSAEAESKDQNIQGDVVTEEEEGEELDPQLQNLVTNES